MNVKHLKCIACGRIYDSNIIIYRCACGQSLDVIYDYKKIHLSWKVLRARRDCHWRYREFFPLKEKSRIITMEEGGTPLIKSDIIGRKMNINLFFKYEGLNPTGSFKDRGTTVEISKALEFGAKRLVCASTGNMGASVAAYTSRAGLEATIMVPAATTTHSKIHQIRVYGTRLKLINGDYTKAMHAAYKEYKKGKAYLMGDYAYRGEGEKSVSYEIIEQLDKVPDYIVTPVGNGTLITGMWKGLKELKETHLTSKTPRMIGVQATGCNTVVKTLKTKNENIKPLIPKTKASAIACGDPLDGIGALRALRESHGHGITVNDNEMRTAQRLLAREGIYSELSGAAPLAGLIKKKLPMGSTAVLVVTGHGLKDA